MVDFVVASIILEEFKVVRKIYIERNLVTPRFFYYFTSIIGIINRLGIV